MSRNKLSINHDETGELLGFVVRSHADTWEAQTVFGYVMERVRSTQAAERIVRQQATDFVKGVWQYYDQDDSSWYPCVIKEASQASVAVFRTNAMGYQEPDSYKLTIIESPDETKLIKSQ